MDLELSTDDKEDADESALAAAKKRFERWSKEIEDAEKRDKEFLKAGKKLCDLYEAGEKREFQFNILYSNTETLAPALYNATPRPVVRTRHKKPSPEQIAASQVGQGILEYLLDDNGSEADTFSKSMRAAVLAGLVPGRGVTWYTYDPTIKKVERPAKEGEDANKTYYDEEVLKEYICVEEVPWDEFRHGFAKTWRKVPWVARLLHWTREDAELHLPAEVVAEMSFDTSQDSAGEGETEASKAIPHDSAPVYQIFDKATRKVVYFSPCYKDDVLKEDEDPYELEGFFPCTEPLRFVERLSNLSPVALYTLYEEQAKELNAITVRINRLTRALKVRGGYDNNMGELKDILNADDNVLLPVTNAAALSSQGVTLDKGIWLFPIEKLITVLQQLHIQREACKQVIYEITGMSDIVRGASVASETATAQSIKDKWSGVRIKRPQATVQNYVRAGLRLMLELAVTKLPPEELKVMSGTSIPMEQEKQAQLLAMQQQVTQTGQPNPAMQQLAQTPSFEQALAILQNDLSRKYVVDIETNSTIDAEATEDKQDIAEMLTSLGQYLGSVGPLIESGVLPFEAGQAMMLAISRRFRFGREVEEHIKAMQPPAKEGNPEADKAMEEVQKAQEKLKADEMQLAFDRKVFEMEQQFAERVFNMEKQFAMREIKAEVQFAGRELDQRTAHAEQKIAAKEDLTTKRLSMDGQRLAEKRQADEGKIKQSEQNLQTQISANQEIIGAVKDMMAEISQAIVTGIQQAMSVQKRAVKDKDGSWRTEPIPSPTPGQIQ